MMSRMIGILSLILCGLGVWQHYTMFPYEYRPYIVKAALQDYAPFIMLAAIIVGGLIAITLSFGTSGPANISSITSMMPNIMPNSRPANNKGSFFNLSGNNNRRNNLASSSFMTV